MQSQAPVILPGGLLLLGLSRLTNLNPFKIWKSSPLWVPKTLLGDARDPSGMFD